MRELLVDNFAGGGGASTGIALALGVDVDIAINHKLAALWMHRANHPQTEHFPEDVFAVDPVRVTKGRPVGLAWFSPDCTHFSTARGGKPKSKTVRGLAWLALRWGVLVRPRVIIIENVPEFRTWGPTLPNGRVCPDNISRTFNTWGGGFTTGIRPDNPDIPEIRERLGYDFPIAALVGGLGYQMEMRELRGFEYGAPTIRKRLFIILRCDGCPIVWPRPTHGDPKLPETKRLGLKPWRTAAECIDFSLPCPSIFLSPAEARKLKVKRPLVKATCRRIAKGVQRYVMEAETPFLVCLTQCVDSPLAGPFITEHANGSHQRNFSADEPLRTACAGVKGGHFAVVSPVVAGVGGRAGQSRERAADEPFATITSKADSVVCAAHVARQFGTSIGHGADEPSGTVTTQGCGKSQVIASFLAQHNTGVIGHGCDEPFSTLTMRGTQQQLVSVSLLKYYGTDQDPQINEPLHTATTRDRFGISNASVGIPPLTPELAAMARKVAAFLREHGVEFEGEFATTKSGLVIYDIGMRMFVPRELYLAQGFPRDYVIDPYIEVKRGKKTSYRRLTKTEQIEMCGNSVCPPVAAALVGANVPEIKLQEVAA